jgi:hypothetical protein
VKIEDRYSGQDILFEGTRTVLLKSIPVGANIVSAQITLTPVNSVGGSTPSVDQILFDDSGAGTIQGQSGRFATKTQVDGTGWVEVDFHGRRTLVSVSGSDLLTDGDIQGASMQVDIGGGSFIDINANGAFKGPEDTPFTLQNANLPGLTVNRVKLTSQSIPANNPDISTISIRNTPGNVSLALDELPAFWMHPGEMIGSQTTPDFSELLQSVLLEADSENGFYTIPLILHSETLARLDVDFDIEYQQQVDVLPPGLSEVILPYDYNGAPLAESGLLTLSIPANARVLPGKTEAQVIGDFIEERIVQGPIGEVGTKISVEISPQNGQAHLITIGEDVTGSAFDFLLRPVDELVRLQLDLRQDLDGKPDSASLLTEPVNFSLDRKSAPGANWRNVKLPQGFRFEELVQTRRLWLVIQSLAGRTQWVASAAGNTDVGMQHSKDGGLSWRKTLLKGVSMVAQYRLRNTPLQFKVPIHLQVGEGELARAVSLERFQALGRVDFNLDFDEVAETINQHIEATAPQLCPEVEHVANNEFTQTFLIEEKIINKPKPMLVDWELTMGSWNIDQSPITLGDEESAIPTGISQITPVKGGCYYQFEVDAWSTDAGAVAEVIWKSVECGVAQTDRLVILSRSFSTSDDFPQPNRVRLKAPDNAVQAEIRIKVPEENRTTLEFISLMATNEAVLNSDLKEHSDEQIGIEKYFQGWELEADEDVFLGDPQTGLQNFSSNEIILSQIIPVLPNKPYLFSFTGRSMEENSASLKLTWEKTGAELVTSAIVEELTPDMLKQHSLQGVVPVEADRLKIQIVLPPGSRLSIENVSFRQPEMVDLPLNLISQAPGELTLSNVQIAYETIEPRPLEVPEAGLCSATPADSEPGDVCKQTGVCPACHSETQIINIEVVRTPANRPATVGRCENCNAEISRLGGRLDTTARVFPDRRSIVNLTRTSSDQ